MSLTDTPQGETDSNQLLETVASWPAITTGTGRFNPISFQMRTEEIGHVHPRGAVDSSSPPPLRDQLMGDGRPGNHHISLHPPTATTFSIDSTDAIDTAVWLLQLSSLYHMLGHQTHERTGTAPKLTDIDVEAEVDDLDSSDALRNAFELTTGHGL